jgi:heptosyltransferase-2
MNIGASYGSAKRWMPERFAELGDSICDELKGEVILFGSSDDLNIENETKGKMKHTLIIVRISLIGFPVLLLKKRYPCFVSLIAFVSASFN